jgi:hypothetical protein
MLGYEETFELSSLYTSTTPHSLTFELSTLYTRTNSHSLRFELSTLYTIPPHSLTFEWYEYKG